MERVPNGNCGDKVWYKDNMVVVACMENGAISVWRIQGTKHELILNVLGIAATSASKQQDLGVIQHQSPNMT